MPIKTTLQKVVDANVALSILTAADLPNKAAYTVSKLATACAREIRDYEKKRKSIFEKAGCTVKEHKDEKTKEVISSEWVHVEKEKLDAAIKEADELLELECEINALPFKLEHFGDVRLKGAAFMNLDWAMVEPAAEQ